MKNEIFVILNALLRMAEKEGYGEEVKGVVDAFFAQTETPLEELGLHGSHLKALKKHGGLVTVEDIVSCTAPELLRIPNFSRKGLGAVTTALKSRGLELRPTPGDGDS